MRKSLLNTDTFGYNIKVVAKERKASEDENHQMEEITLFGETFARETFAK